MVGVIDIYYYYRQLIFFFNCLHTRTIRNRLILTALGPYKQTKTKQETRNTLGP